MQENLSHPKYRPDIDGLRAVAVLSVITFHAFPGWMKGGFIGVDIFFVISGYLISTIIFENLDKQTFSFAQFYARRIKRIFPALVLVLIFCYAFGWITLLADEYKQLGKHITASAGFVQNIVLLRESGYFDNSAETKPLLHLWSLGIEEQFYFTWPLLAWLAWKKKFNLFAITIAVLIFSFVLNIVGTQTEKGAVTAFYSPLTRFWELLSGSLLAWLTLYGPDIHKSKKVAVFAQRIQENSVLVGRATIASLFSFFGVLFLACGFWGLSKDLNFPGGWALIPVLGAVAIIAAGPTGWINRNVLAHKIAVWVGLISYPLYLWHWPLLSFARIIEGQTPSVEIRVAAVAVSIGLAWLTYKLIERPIRSGQRSRSAIAALAFSMLAVGLIGMHDYRNDGLLFRFDRLSPELKSEIGKIANAWNFTGYPQPQDAYVDPKYGFLRLGRNSDDVVLFVGDSHMEHYKNTVGELLNHGDKSSAPSVLFGSITELGFPPKIGSELIADPSFKRVIFSFYWSLLYGSDRVNQLVRCCGSGKYGAVTATAPISDSAKMDRIDEQLLAGIQKLVEQGKEVYIVLDTPFGEEFDPHSMLKRSLKGFAFIKPDGITKDVALLRTEPIRSRIVRIAKKTGSKLIDPFDYLCNSQICPAFSSEGELLYKDYDHVSLFAAKYKVRYLDFIMDK